MAVGCDDITRRLRIPPVTAEIIGAEFYGDR